MELTLKRKEAREYLQKLQQVASLKCDNDPDNKFGWAWQKNFNKFLAIDKENMAMQQPKETEELKLWREEWLKKNNEFNEQYKANISANRGQYPDEIAKEWEGIENEIFVNHPVAKQQVMEQEKILNEYLNQDVVTEIHTVTKPYHPKMNGQQIQVVSFMLTESELRTV
jgi:hypothetical protein